MLPQLSADTVRYIKTQKQWISIQITQFFRGQTKRNLLSSYRVNVKYSIIDFLCYMKYLVSNVNGSRQGT